MTIKESDLTLATENTFDDQTIFRVLLKGKSGLLPRPLFAKWLKETVKGEKGDQGLDGINGINGTNGRDGARGEQGLSAYQVAVSNGYVGTVNEWLISLNGTNGKNGDQGDQGWSPVLSLVSRNDDLVQRVVDWTGGTGTKPTITGYIGTSGIVDNIINAVNVKGEQGEKGDQGLTGEQGLRGDNGTTITGLSYNSQNVLSITTSDGDTISSNNQSKLTGWGRYKDSAWTEATPFVVQPTNQIVVPNNASITSDNLPSDVTSFYNTTSQKILLNDNIGAYQIRVRAKVLSTTQEDNNFITLSFSKDTTEIPFSQDITLRKEGGIHNIDVNTVIYADDSTKANGISVRLKSNSVLSLYDIEFIVVKVV